MDPILRIPGGILSGGGGGPTPDPIPLDAINANGWSATYSTPPAEYDPAGDPVTFAVARSGFNASGSAVTVNDTLTVMKRIRNPYPSEASLTADQVGLSDFVYASDVVVDVDNNSTRAYPKPIPMWLNHDLEIAREATHTLRLCVAHAHARDGKPVAAVKFILSDGTDTVEQTVSTLTKVDYAASGLSVPCYEAEMDLTGLDTAVLLTVDCIIYPWVGEEFQASVDGEVYPSINFSTLRLFNDSANTYGTAYAYVDGVGAGTPTTSTNPLTAAANPYATLALAAAAIKTFNNANFARNNASGGIVRLLPGTHVHSTYRTTANTGTIPLTIEAADPADKATTIYADSGVNATSSTPGLLIFRNITLRKTGGSITFMDNTTSSLTVDDLIAFVNCTFDRNGQTIYDAWIYRVGRCWLINCDGDECGQGAAFSTIRKEVIAIGSGEGSIRRPYHAVGCKAIGQLVDNQTAANRNAPVGTFHGWNFVTLATNGQKVYESNLASGPKGRAIIYNTFEQTAGATGPTLSMAADGNVAAQDNILMFGNTVVGSRSNVCYQDVGVATIAKTCVEKFNVHYQRNTKSDVFGTNANLVGNWPVIYKVASQSNAALTGWSSGGTTGVGLWLGEVDGLGDAYGSSGTPLDPDWADDQSFFGGGAGYGDYTPGPATELPTIPAGMAPYPWDMNGNAIADDGSAFIGALQA